MNLSVISTTAAFLLLFFSTLSAQRTDVEHSWNQPVEPFRIIGNIYYVGASDLTSYLITTPKGHLLIDSGSLETVPQIKANIVKLGFKVEDVKILLNSHAHYDHAGGLAELRRVTGAKLWISEPDTRLLANGGKEDPNFGDRFPFEPTKADRTFRDGKKIRLGATTLTANITAGHTRGCTTWTTSVIEERNKYDVIFLCSTSAPGYNLVDNRAYPTIAADYERTFDHLEKLSVNVFLGSHGIFFDLQGKIARAKTEQGSNPFIDPEGYRKYLEASRAAFEKLRNDQRKVGR
jgi:metallo-beta-lactamase class B